MALDISATQRYNLENKNLIQQYNLKQGSFKLFGLGGLHSCMKDGADLKIQWLNYVDCI